MRTRIKDAPTGADNARMATKIKVNGVEYDSVDAMPPDVRQVYDRILEQFPKLSDGAVAPTVKTNEIKMTFELKGPHFSIHKSLGATASQPPATLPTGEFPKPAPLEPGSAEGGFRLALILGFCAAVGLVLLLLARAH